MPLTPKVGIDLPVRGVDCLEEAVHREDQPAVLAVFALPVVDALARDAAQPVVDPDLLAGRRVQRDDRRLVPAEPVEHVTSVDRTEDRRAVRIVPGHLELADVGLGDLLERAEVRAVERRAAFWSFAGRPARRARPRTAVRRQTHGSPSARAPLARPRSLLRRCQRLAWRRRLPGLLQRNGPIGTSMAPLGSAVRNRREQDYQFIGTPAATSTAVSLGVRTRPETKSLSWLGIGLAGARVALGSGLVMTGGVSTTAAGWFAVGRYKRPCWLAASGFSSSGSNQPQKTSKSR